MKIGVSTMLNEIQEYKEYTCDITPQMPFRLSYMNLKNNLGGVRRAMTIIARRALYHYDMTEEEVTKLLNAWCGFKIEPPAEGDDSKTAMFDQLTDWLPRYMDELKKHIENTESGKKGKDKQSAADKGDQIDGIKDLLLGKANDWNYSPFFSDGGKNDENTITFTKIIADARFEGPLIERVLVFEKDPLPALVTSKGPGAGNKKRYLRAIAAYCLLARDDRKKVHLNYPAFSNWMGEGGGDSKKTGAQLSKLSFKTGKGTAKLFSEENAGSMSVPYPKLLLNQDYAEEYRPAVMPKTELQMIPAEKRRSLIIFTDLGFDNDLVSI